MNETNSEQITVISDNQKAVPQSTETTMFGTVLTGFGNLLIATGTYLKRQAVQNQARKFNNQRHIDVIQLS